MSIIDVINSVATMDLVELNKLDVAVNLSNADRETKELVFEEMAIRKTELRTHDVETAMAVCAKIEED